MTDPEASAIDMTIRELFAIIFAPACIEMSDGQHGVRDAVRTADDLIRELNKPPEGT